MDLTQQSFCIVFSQSAFSSPADFAAQEKILFSQTIQILLLAEDKYYSKVHHGLESDQKKLFSSYQIGLTSYVV